MRNQWYKSKWSVVSFHILVWIVFYLLPLILQSDDHGRPFDWKQAIFNNVHIGIIVASILFFYLNTYFLIPTFLNKGNQPRYIVMLLVTMVAWTLMLGIILHLTNKNHSHDPFSVRKDVVWLIFPFIFVWSISTLYRTSSDAAKIDQLLKEKENENLKTELSFLRSQVSPHFLFNVLNNMVALARRKSEVLEPSLIKLSGLLRYMLYESDEDRVALNREVEYIQSYIDLQRMRFGNDMKISVDMEDFQEQYYLIEPMLLIPFIENAFKHGTGMIVDPAITISLKAANGVLDFSIRNKYNQDSVEVKDKTSGIGLNNVIRRLNLLYDKRHSLAIEKENGWFVVQLQIKLQ